MIDLSTRRFVVDSDQEGINTLYGLYDLIKEIINPEFVICEIGSYKGVSSALFAEHVKHIFCIDPWKIYWDGIPGGVLEHETIHNAEFEFDKRMASYKNYTKIKKTSEEAVNDFKDGSFNLIYIDGSHKYENVKNDILTWKNKVVDGGYICGHDSNLFDVIKAIDETIGIKNIKTFSDSSWYFKKE